MNRLSWWRGAPAISEESAPPAPSHGFVGLASAAAALGVQLTLFAMLVVKPPVRDLSKLTSVGIGVYLPERDGGLYLSGIIFTLGLVIVLTLAGKVLGRFFRQATPLRSQPVYTLVQITVAVLGTALFLARFLDARTLVAQGSHVPGSLLAILLMTVLGTLGVAVAGMIPFGGKRRAPGAGIRTDVTVREEMGRLRLSIWDLVVPVVIVVSIYVPHWRQVAGRALMQDGLLHWEFFGLAPALAYRHGLAIGTDVLTNYGMGWHLLLSGLSSWIPLSYGRIIQIGSIYACAYVMGVYLFLRLLVRRPLLAVCGTLLVILPLFVERVGEIGYWGLPSVTVLRSPFAIWCFISLLLHRRSNKRIWAVLAGALVGLAIVFVTDTGLQLSVAVAFYWLCLLRLREDPVPKLVDLAAGAFAAAAVAITGLTIASRGTILSAAFWNGWLEAPREFSAGYFMLPLATVPEGVTVASFAVFVFAYLVVLGYSVAMLVEKRARHFEVFNGFLALYGLLYLYHFIGRSDDGTILRLSMPLALILISLAGHGWSWAESYLARSSPGNTQRSPILVSWAAGGVAAAALLAVLVGPRSWLVDPALGYPSLVSAWVKGSPPDGLCLVMNPRDICGLSATMEGLVAESREITERLMGYKRAGLTFTVLDDFGFFYHYATDTRPFGRYNRPIVQMWSKQKVQEVVQSFRDDSPDIVLTRPVPAAAPYVDTTNILIDDVHRRYRLDGTVGSFEIWKRPGVA